MNYEFYRISIFITGGDIVRQKKIYKYHILFHDNGELLSANQIPN